MRNIRTSCLSASLIAQENVYNSDIDVSQALPCMYELGSTYMVQECGSYRHQAILDCFANSDELKWPPPAQDLLGNMDDVFQS